ncbi:hypothetical protein [Sabulicella glaciei]|uniref:Uncharacterized protein n=1 Tax=Sabulicella glaciei TaxID=2984948 RepID=A0ABT3NVS0_9PROT|nr:hypothetical protein [Roseococcus sp. MDT2-1-1]MCW8086262.1 hypothetical protein [Roseococcus sp. MDT2-1-1]
MLTRTGFEMGLDRPQPMSMVVQFARRLGLQAAGGATALRGKGHTTSGAEA